MVGTATLKYGFSPIASTVSSVYDVDILLVNFGVTSFFVGYLVANFPSIHLLDKGEEPGQGLFWCLKICTAIQIVAAWGRYFALALTDNFYLLMIF